MTTPPDWNDPCAKADALRKAYYDLISGRQAYKVDYLANGVSRSVTYSVINMKLLLQELRDAESECAASSGGEIPTRRYAITAGSIRRAWPDSSE